MSIGKEFLVVVGKLIVELSNILVKITRNSIMITRILIYDQTSFCLYFLLIQLEYFSQCTIYKH